MVLGIWFFDGSVHLWWIFWGFFLFSLIFLSILSIFSFLSQLYSEFPLINVQISLNIKPTSNRFILIENPPPHKPVPLSKNFSHFPKKVINNPFFMHEKNQKKNKNKNHKKAICPEIKIYMESEKGNNISPPSNSNIRIIKNNKKIL